MARPVKVVDQSKIEKLAAIGCTAEEIGAELGCSARTIFRRYGSLLRLGLKKRDIQVRNALFKQAMAGNTSILIFVAKCWLGMKEPPENALTVNVSAQTNVTVRSPEQIKAHLLDLQKAVREEAKRLELN